VRFPPNAPSIGVTPPRRPARNQVIQNVSKRADRTAWIGESSLVVVELSVVYGPPRYCNAIPALGKSAMSPFPLHVVIRKHLVMRIVGEPEVLTAQKPIHSVSL
jgi:hypothetical protein